MLNKNGKLGNMVIFITVVIAGLNYVTGTLEKSDSSLSNLYNHLLQREYVEPIPFSDHHLERKAQRSPSLRLRFGRSDPNILKPLIAEKRWFGDVNKKPIRSPSLRLRFGRRSDPLMISKENYMYIDDFELPSLLNEIDNDKRRPTTLRLRWGRSSYPDYLNNYENYLQNFGLLKVEPISTEQQQIDKNLRNEPLQELLSNLQKIDENQSQNEYEREIRKPSGPLRLRWGRSTGSGQDKELSLQSTANTHTGKGN